MCCICINMINMFINKKYNIKLFYMHQFIHFYQMTINNIFFLFITLKKINKYLREMQIRARFCLGKRRKLINLIDVL